jgi:HEXXH motif-containing protein
MEVLEAAVAPLSHPGVGGRDAVTETIIDAHSRVVVEGAERKFRRTLSPGICEVIKAFVDVGGGWSPQFGAFEEAVRFGSRDTVLATAAQLAVRAHDQGIAGAWQEACGEPVWFRFGETSVEQLVAIAVDAGPVGYQVAGTGPSGQAVRHSVARTSPPSRPGLGQTSLGGVSIRLSSREDLCCLPGSEFLVHEDWNISADLGRAVDELGTAEQLLMEFSPSFLDWVGGVLRQVVFTDPGPGLMESGSSRGLPGFVHMSHGDALALAEMLTHELSHQYYYLATRLAPVDDGTDTTLYWSPVKQTGRPIANILLAYHAFGNVVLVMRELLNSGAAPESAIAANEAETVAQLIALQRGLEATSALTEIGTGLYEPLRDALQLDAR